MAGFKGKDTHDVAFMARSCGGSGFRERTLPASSPSEGACASFTSASSSRSREEKAITRGCLCSLPALNGRRCGRCVVLALVRPRRVGELAIAPGPRGARAAAKRASMLYRSSNAKCAEKVTLFGKFLHFS